MSILSARAYATTNARERVPRPAVSPGNISAFLMLQMERSKRQGPRRPSGNASASASLPQVSHLGTHRSVVKMYPTRSLQLNSRTQKATAKSSGGEMRDTASEKGGLWAGRLRSAPTAQGSPGGMSTCDQHGDPGAPLGLLDVSSAQRIPNSDAGSHAEARGYLQGEGNRESRNQPCLPAPEPRSAPSPGRGTRQTVLRASVVELGPRAVRRVICSILVCRWQPPG